MLIFLAYVSFPVLGLMACFDMTCFLNYFYGGFSVASVETVGCRYFAKILIIKITL